MARSLRCVALLLLLILGMIHLSHATRLPIQGAAVAPARRLLGPFEDAIAICQTAYTTACKTVLDEAARALKLCLRNATSFAVFKQCYLDNQTAINDGYAAAKVVFDTCVAAAKAVYEG